MASGTDVIQHGPGQPSRAGPQILGLLPDIGDLSSDISSSSSGSEDSEERRERRKRKRREEKKEKKEKSKKHKKEKDRKKEKKSSSRDHKRSRKNSPRQDLDLLNPIYFLICIRFSVTSSLMISIACTCRQTRNRGVSPAFLPSLGPPRYSLC